MFSFSTISSFIRNTVTATMQQRFSLKAMLTTVGIAVLSYTMFPHTEKTIESSIEWLCKLCPVKRRLLDAPMASCELSFPTKVNTSRVLFYFMEEPADDNSAFENVIRKRTVIDVPWEMSPHVKTDKREQLRTMLKDWMENKSRISLVAVHCYMRKQIEPDDGAKCKETSSAISPHAEYVISGTAVANVLDELMPMLEMEYAENQITHGFLDITPPIGLWFLFQFPPFPRTPFHKFQVKYIRRTGYEKENEIDALIQAEDIVRRNVDVVETELTPLQLQSISCRNNVVDELLVRHLEEMKRMKWNIQTNRPESLKVPSMDNRVYFAEVAVDDATKPQRVDLYRNTFRLLNDTGCIKILPSLSPVSYCLDLVTVLATETQKRKERERRLSNEVEQREENMDDVM